MGSLIDILILCQSLILRSMRMMEMIPKYNLTLLAFDNTTLATIKAEYKQVRGKYFRSVVTFRRCRNIALALLSCKTFHVQPCDNYTINVNIKRVVWCQRNSVSFTKQHC